MSIKISQQGLSPTVKTQVIDEFKQRRMISIVGENPLTIHIDKQEIVTLMTLGTHPEALVLGYLRNQYLITDIEQIVSIEVDWQQEKAEVSTKNGIKDLHEKIAKRTITTGCGQGTVFSCVIDKVYNAKLSAVTIKQSTIYALLKNLNQHNKVYKSAGAVHSCALCKDEQVIISVEDVGRHNAADIISGLMWLDELNDTQNFIFYTTGRITSEIVMKIAQMQIPIILSRSGVTQMGLEIAQDVGIMIIARAKAKHFLIFSGTNQLIFDHK